MHTYTRSYEYITYVHTKALELIYCNCFHASALKDSKFATDFRRQEDDT